VTLRRGDTGPLVAGWQIALEGLGYLTAALVGAGLGTFGPRTEKATTQFQVDRGLPGTGVVDAATFGQLGAPGNYPRPPASFFDQRWRFVPAKNFTPANREPANVTLGVLHTMQAPDRPDTAEGVAAWFAGQRGPAPEASSHICADADSIVLVVDPRNVAWGAQGANACGYQVEQAGYADWTRDRWLSDENLPMLKLVASHLRLACQYFGFPAVALSNDEVAAVIRDDLVRRRVLRAFLSGLKGGLCQHRQVTAVWQAWEHYELPNPRSDPKPWWPTHTDCGDGYPIDEVVRMVTAA
jgi:hypothetical protein